MADPWYYNSASGKIQQATNAIDKASIAAELHLGLDWHGPFNTKQAALDYYTNNKAKNPGWKKPTDSTLDALGNASGVTDAANAVGDTITNKLGLSNENITAWMVRIGEILLGIVLVGVGIAKLTGTTNMIANAVKAKL